MTQAPSLPHTGVMAQKELDLTALLADGRHFSERRGDRVYVIDSLTGNTIVMYAETPTRVPTQFVPHTTDDGVTTWIQEGLQPAAVDEARQVLFSPAIIHLMCNEIALGKSVTKLCGTPPFPTYPVLRKWARVHPWIDEEIERARRDRAEHFRDRVIEEAENSESHKDPILASQLKVDTYRWAASMDHERYNPKTKVEATLNTPTVIQVITGINRDPTPGVREVTPEQIPTPGVGEAPPTDDEGTYIPKELRQFDE